MYIIPIVLLLIAGIIVTFGDIIMKNWVVSNDYNLYAIGMMIYLIGLNFLAQSYKYKNIAVASIIFVIFNIVILSIVSWFYFKEKLSTFEIIGIVLGLTSVVILELSGK